jgi:hypothetical protein
MEDLGETFPNARDFQEQTFRHVRLDGRAVWVQDGFAFRNEDGRVFGSDALDVVPEPGRDAAP